MVTSIPPLGDSEKLEFGSNVTTRSSPKAKLVIASYNIRYARGPHLISGGILRKLGRLNHKVRPAIVQRNIKTAARIFSDGNLFPPPDVIALQEADKRTARSGGIHIAKELASQLSMTWVHAPAGIPRGIKPLPRQWWLDFEEPIELDDEGDTGVAILSRFPLKEVERIDLPWNECPWRPRLAMSTAIAIGESELLIFNAHVDPHAAADGQLKQLETIGALANRSPLPSLILGDFNTLSTNKCKETRGYLESLGFQTVFPTGTPTWRGAGLRLHADWVFSKGVTIERWGVVKPMNVSDHWPIWVEVSVS